MTSDKEIDDIKNDTQSSDVRNMLSGSEIYVKINKIIDAYEKSLVIEKDDIFCVQAPNSKEDKKFNILKYMEARKLYSSGKLQDEITDLRKKLKNHRYILSKNREKDKENLELLISKCEKIKTCACYIDTKKEWDNIIDDNYPSRNYNSYTHSIGYFVDIYKDLSKTMEDVCSRHKDDPVFAAKLNYMIEEDMKADGSNEEGKNDLRFAVQHRGDFVRVLDRNVAKYIQSETEFINEQSL